MGKILVVYATRTGETGRMANLIAEGVRMEGSEAVVSAEKTPASGITQSGIASPDTGG